MKQHISTFRMMLVVILLVGLFAFVGVASSHSPETAGPDAALAPDAPTSLLFSYQGQLLDTNGAPITDPTVDMIFKLYDVAELGTACWTEDHTGGDAVDVEDGLFNVLLGQITVMDTACLISDAYLELIVNGEAMSPRELLTSVAHSLEASTLMDGATTQGDLVVTGNLSLTGDQLHVNSDGDADDPVGKIMFQNNDGIIFNDTAIDPGTFSFDADNGSRNAFLLAGAAYLNSSYESSYRLVVGGNVSMADSQVMNVRGLQLKDWDDDSGGDDNKYRLLARDGAWQFFDGGVVVGNYDNSTWADLADGTLIVEGNVGIGTTNPQANLSVGMSGASSSMQVGHGTSDMVEIGWDGYPYIQAQDSHTPNGYGLALNPSGGNVGIGTTSPSEKLDVDGNIRTGNYLVMGGTDLVMEDVPDRGGGRALVNDSNDILTINYNTDFTGGVRINGTVHCGALVESNLQTVEEQESGRIDRFEEGDVLCWSPESGQLELCTTDNSRLVMAVADLNGKPIVMGAESVKVLGPVVAGDYLVASDVPGYATATDNPAFGIVIAQSLEDFDGNRGLIKAMIRKM